MNTIDTHTHTVDNIKDSGDKRTSWSRALLEWLAPVCSHVS